MEGDALKGNEGNPWTPPPSFSLSKRKRRVNAQGEGRESVDPHPLFLALSTEKGEGHTLKQQEGNPWTPPMDPSPIFLPLSKGEGRESMDPSPLFRPHSHENEGGTSVEEKEGNPWNPPLSFSLSRKEKEGDSV